MTNAKKIAVIATSHAEMGGGKKTGVWLDELTTPYYAFIDAGRVADVYAIAGGAIPIDPRSQQAPGGNEASVERYLQDAAARAAFQNARPLGDLDLSRYAALFLPGGHGVMWDFPRSETLAVAIRDALAAGKIVAAVCHGPAGLIAARDESGAPIVRGRRVAGFSNAEERAAGLSETVPFLLETRLRALGADYRSGPDFQPFVVSDGDLITGQNPASAGPAAGLVIEALTEKMRAAA